MHPANYYIVVNFFWFIYSSWIIFYRFSIVNWDKEVLIMWKPKKSKNLTKFFLVIFICVLSQNSNAETIVKVFDGDTVKLSDGRSIRLLGVDTPESWPNGKAMHDSKATGMAIRDITRMGQLAKKFTKSRALWQEVTLEYDHDRTDKYGRTLAYIRLKDGTLLNEQIIENGYGCMYRKFEFIHKAEFTESELRAKKSAAGLWPKLNCN